MLKKPLIVFGYPKYSEIFDKSFEKCFNLYQLPNIVEKILKKPKSINDKFLLESISTILRGSVPVNYYNNFLKKKNRHKILSKENKNYEKDQFISYLEKRIKEVI